MAWLAEQEAELKRQLEDSELKLYQYKKDRNLLAVSLDDKQSMLSQNLASVNAKLTELHIRLLEMDAKRKMIQQARDNIADEETLPEIRENEDDPGAARVVRPAVEGVRRPVVALRPRAPEDEGHRRPDGDHPEGVRAGDRRRSWPRSRSRYQELLDNERVAEGADGAAEATRPSSSRRSRSSTSRSSARRSRKRRCTAIIANRQKEIDITGPMKTNNVRVLERAVVPNVPVRPKPVQNLLLGLMMGLGAGIGLAFAIEALDNTLKTQADVEQFLGTPVLGLVPIIGAAPGGEAVQGRRQPAGARPGRIPGSRSRSPPSAADRFARTSCSCRRTGR